MALVCRRETGVTATEVEEASGEDQERAKAMELHHAPGLTRRALSSLSSCARYADPCCSVVRSPN